MSHSHGTKIKPNTGTLSEVGAGGDGIRDLPRRPAPRLQWDGIAVRFMQELMQLQLQREGLIPKRSRRVYVKRRAPPSYRRLYQNPFIKHVSPFLSFTTSFTITHCVTSPKTAYIFFWHWPLLHVVRCEDVQKRPNKTPWSFLSTRGPVNSAL